MEVDGNAGNVCGPWARKRGCLAFSFLTVSQLAMMRGTRICISRNSSCKYVSHYIIRLVTMQQQYLLVDAPRRKKTGPPPSPWWDFLNCKKAVDSSDSEDDDDVSYVAHVNYNDMMRATGFVFANDDLMIKESAPLNGKSISAQCNKADGDTPRTQDFSFSSSDSETISSCSSFPDDGDDDDGNAVASLQPISVEVEVGDIEDIISDDDYNFIGNIDVMPISPLLSTYQRNIRKNAYDLLQRLGEEESMFDVNSVEAEVEREEEEEEGDKHCDCGQWQKKQQMKEIDALKRQLGECVDLVAELHANLRCNSNGATATNDDDVTFAGMNNEDVEVGDDNIMDALHTEIANLKSQLHSATLQSRLMMQGSRSSFPSSIGKERSNAVKTDGEGIHC